MGVLRTKQDLPRAIPWALWDRIFSSKAEATWEDFKGGIQQKKELKENEIKKMLDKFTADVKDHVQGDIKALFERLKKVDDRPEQKQKSTIDTIRDAISPRSAKVTPMDPAE